jgi:3-methylcrotonyl-CoA carboxylase alpha subunit
VQRRHQKVVEEAPSRLAKAQQDKLFESAILAAKAVNY